MVLMICFVVMFGGAVCYISMMKTMEANAATMDQEFIEDSQKTNQNGEPLQYADTGIHTDCLMIPVPEQIKDVQIQIENHYMEKQIWIRLEGVEKDFYSYQYLTGNMNKVKEGFFYKEGEYIWLQIQLDDFYEINTVLENQYICISFLKPEEKYEKIVLLDPANDVLDSQFVYEGYTQEEITRKVAAFLKSRLDESDIKLYYTRIDGTDDNTQKKLDFLSKVKVDLCLRLEVGASKDSQVYGTETIYNGTYFIPGFGSVQWADLVERNVVLMTNGNAMGLSPATEQDILINEATVPAATLKIGYVTNKQENQLLNRDEYLNKVAEGIYYAILQAFE